MKTINRHEARITFGCAMAAIALMAFSPTAARADRDDWNHNRGNHYGWSRPQNPHNNWAWQRDNDQRFLHRDRDDRGRFFYRRDHDDDWYRHHRRVWDRDRGLYIWIRI